MARTSTKSNDLDTIRARREALQKELAKLAEQEKAAALAAKDAGRETLTSAFERVKISAMDRQHAKVIAKAIEKHGGEAVARHLEALDAT